MNSDGAARSAEAREWAAGPGRLLVGRPLDEARSAALAAGLRVKTVPADGVATMEFGIGRVRIAVDDAARVTAITAG